MVTIPAPSPAALVDHPHCERSFPGDISPARHLVTVAYEIVQRDAVAARGLHACNIRDNDLPVAEKQLKLRGQFIPFGLAGQYRYRIFGVDCGLFNVTDLPQTVTLAEAASVDFLSGERYEQDTIPLSPFQVRCISA